MSIQKTVIGRVAADTANETTVSTLETYKGTRVIAVTTDDGEPAFLSPGQGAELAALLTRAARDAWEACPLRVVAMSADAARRALAMNDQPVDLGPPLDAWRWKDGARVWGFHGPDSELLPPSGGPEVRYHDHTAARFPDAGAPDALAARFDRFREELVSARIPYTEGAPPSGGPVRAIVLAPVAEAVARVARATTVPIAFEFHRDGWSVFPV